ncbi:ATP-binding cassette domain-containing protein [Candidatus Mycoplasma pogonae]
MAILASFISAILTAVLYFLPIKTLDYLLQYDIYNFSIYILLEILATAAVFFFSWLSNFFKRKWEKFFLITLQQKIIEAKSFTTESNETEIFKYITKDLDFLKQLYFGAIFHIVEKILVISSFLALAIFVSWKIFLIIFITVLLLIMISIFLKKHANKIGYNFDENNKIYQKEIIEIYNSYDTFYFFNKLNIFYDMFSRSSKRYETNINKINNNQNAYQFLVGVLNELNRIAVFIAVGFLILYQQIQINNILTITFIVGQLFYNISSLFDDLINLSKSQAIAKNITKIVEVKNNNIINSEEIHQIKLEAQTFIFEKNSNLINIPEINIEKNQKYWIHGKSGIGKSTILKAILGTLKNNVVKLKYNNLPKEPQEIINYWSEIVFLEKESSFIEDSIINHVTLFAQKPNVNKLENIFRFLELPIEILKQKITNDNLSSGMKQKLEIARIFYFDKKIIFLDESLSSIDAKMRIKILKALLEKSDVTLIYIDHYLPRILHSQFDYVIKIGGKNA